MPSPGKQFAGVLLPLPTLGGSSYHRWAIPAALTGIALIVAAWFVVDVIMDTLPAGFGGAPRGWDHILLHTGFAVALLACGGVAFAIARANWHKWHSERLAAELTLRASLHRTREQFEAAGRVGQADTLLSGDIQALAREITESAARAIGCERVTIWRFDGSETELHCIDLYETTPNRHSAGLVMHEREFRNEFEALKSLRYIDANDALTDLHTAGYVETYIRPLGITSMLDTAVRVSGRNLGVICFEHVGKPHCWHPDEIAFAGQLADKFAFGLPLELLEIELTETAMMQNAREHRATLERLRKKGCRLAIDDFGTGYSSLDYLRHLPVDRIKIDRAFIGKITSDPGDATIVKAAISIAHDFDLMVVAEGVETAEQLALLHAWGCSEVQGYYFAKPMPPEEAAKLLRQGFIHPERPLAAANS